HCDWTSVRAELRQEVTVAKRRGGEKDRDRLNRKKRQAKSQAGQAVILLAHFASRGDESGRGTGDDQNFEAPEKGDATDLEQTGAYRHRFDGALGPINRGGDRVGHLTPQSPTTPKDGLPDLHESTTRVSFAVASTSRLRSANFSRSASGSVRPSSPSAATV